MAITRGQRVNRVPATKLQNNALTFRLTRAQFFFIEYSNYAIQIAHNTQLPRGDNACDRSKSNVRMLQLRELFCYCCQEVKQLPCNGFLMMCLWDKCWKYYRQANSFSYIDFFAIVTKFRQSLRYSEWFAMMSSGLGLYTLLCKQKFAYAK